MSISCVARVDSAGMMVIGHCVSLVDSAGMMLIGHCVVSSSS